MSYENKERWAALQRWYYIWVASGSAGTAKASSSAFHSEKRGFDNTEIIMVLQTPSVKRIKGPIAQGSTL